MNVNDITHGPSFTGANVTAAIGGSLYGPVCVSQTELGCALFRKDVKVALNAAVVFKKIKNKSNVHSTDLISSARWYHVWKRPESYSEMSDSVRLVSTRSETNRFRSHLSSAKTAERD